MRCVLPLLVLLPALAAADEPTFTVTPTEVHPGEAVLVAVSGAADPPQGKAGGKPLRFFATKHGHLAVFAAPLSINEDHILVEVGAAHSSIPVVTRTFPETQVVVEEELANPDEKDRARIAADNAAMTATYDKAPDELQPTRPFVAPSGNVTSPFGEWRTFNDGHRSQHLGMDFHAREGSKVPAVNDGVVALVRETLLAGNVVVVLHGGHIASLYFHLQKPLVAEGDTLKRGAPVGLAGRTGRTTGPHLHLSIHVDGGMVDPKSFFALPIAR